MATIKHKKGGESAEKKIIDAARKLFTEKGYYAIKTRDIAKEAGINLALLNYYFRSKEKLFAIIMKENTVGFMQIITEIVNDKETTIEEKIKMLVANYIDMLTLNPDMPLFIMSHVQHDDFRMRMREKIMRSFFMKQIQQAIKSKKIANINPINLMMNIVSLTIFPFIARHIFQSDKSFPQSQFDELMRERKKMIPKWIEAMLKVK